MIGIGEIFSFFAGMAILFIPGWLLVQRLSIQGAIERISFSFLFSFILVGALPYVLSYFFPIRPEYV